MSDIGTRSSDVYCVVSAAAGMLGSSAARRCADGRMPRPAVDHDGARAHDEETQHVNPALDQAREPSVVDQTCDPSSG